MLPQAPGACVPATARLLAPKPKSLRRQADFSRLYGQGRRFRTALLTLIVLRRADSEQGVRTAFVISRKVAKQAVRRNRLRRRLREALRALIAVEPAPLDLVIIAHRQAAEADYRQVHAALADSLRRAGLLRRSRQPANEAGEMIGGKGTGLAD